MSENVRVTSTARKISGAWLRRLFWVFFRLNIILLILAVLGFCLSNELAVLGRDWTPGIRRQFVFHGTISDPSLLSAVKNFVVFLPETEYVFYGSGGVPYVVACRDFLFLLLLLGGALLVIEGLFLIGQAASGRRSARKLLRPLDRMAQAAQELSKNAGRAKPPAGDDKLHNLEDAIGRISPDHPGVKLHMGDQDLKGLEDAINALLERMHESYRQQARFVSDASHELRTPIAVIQGYAGMLDRWGKQDQKILDESIAAIRSEVDYMNRLIEQLLFLARGDTGRNHLEFKSVALDELMHEACDDCRLIDKEHDWRITAAEGVSCSGDWDMLKQCVRILTENARKYTPEGGIIHLRCFVDAQQNPCFEVQDSGIGIDGAEMEHVFDRFYRSDPARSRASGGAGLGLSIARWIVESHGGHFRLLSSAGLGTRITVCLPKEEA